MKARYAVARPGRIRTVGDVRDAKRLAEARQFARWDAQEARRAAKQGKGQ